ncbi:MAG: acetyl/propionyl/methylcrotonyl-CoA carboxylase subunit alpha [Hyphomicrobiaceae bacterium]
MLRKILIANRGEIARRIIRTAKRMGVGTVAVYSDADAKALHVREANEAVHIGPSPATESYLCGDKIIAAAKATGAEGIHPGYGFLAENADFAEAAGKAGIKFIGPNPAAMRALGGKAAAKEVAIKAGVPVVPGYQGEKQDAGTLAKEAKRIGYPVMIKAVSGGGGRGMRLVASEAELPELLASAQREAQGAFGDARVLIEKFVEKPRHIEVQVFGDAHGNVVHMFERDCSLQRRNQKVIEEAPAPGMSPELREKMCGAAVKLAKAVGYEGAGTVEFLVEGGALGPDATWYFIEMNTRLQVEHPVTEEITGLDLVEWQLRVASGEELPLAQDEITMSGHAIEARICAEDPSADFMPSIGRIEAFVARRHDEMRLESGVVAGDSISPFYDSMIAKLIVDGNNREAAIRYLRGGLATFSVAGPRTNIPFLMRLLDDDDVRNGAMDTGLIARKMEVLALRRVTRAEQMVGIRALVSVEGQRLAHENDAVGPWATADAFQLGAVRRVPMPLVVDDVQETLTLAWRAGEVFPDVVEDAVAAGSPASVRDHYRFDCDDGLYLLFDGEQVCVRKPRYDASMLDDGGSGDTIRAPINGKVARIFVAEGEAVAKGDRIAVVEAMKMEHVLHAARDGTIAKVAASEGQQVNQGTLIASLVEV